MKFIRTIFLSLVPTLLVGTLSSGCLTIALLAALHPTAVYDLSSREVSVSEDLSFDLEIERHQHLEDKFEFKAQINNDSNETILLSPPKLHLQTDKRTYRVRSDVKKDVLLSPGHSCIIETQFNIRNELMTTTSIVRIKYKLGEQKKHLDITLTKTVD